MTSEPTSTAKCKGVSQEGGKGEEGGEGSAGPTTVKFTNLDSRLDAGSANSPQPGVS